MSKRRNSIERMQNHQWKGREPVDASWSRRFGHLPLEELYGAPELLDLDRLTLHSTVPISGHPQLEARLHTLVSAMAAFAPAVHGVGGHAVRFEERDTPIAVHPGMQA